jgi:outer membrane protein assembly factor BamB
MQALDAKSGKLIWRTASGPAHHTFMAATAPSRSTRTRFTNTTDAHLVALNAVTGKIEWNIKLGKERHATTGGVMVVHGKVITG